MRKFIRFGVFGFALLIIAAPGSVVYAQDSNKFSSTISVQAVVQPHVYIILNKSGDIDEVYSNSDVKVEPIVILGSLSGQLGIYTSVTAAKYSKIEPKIDYTSGPGILYKRQVSNPVPQQTAANIISAFTKPSGLPFSQLAQDS